MKVLVTGGLGFIGSHVVDKLLAGGCETIVVDNVSRTSCADSDSQFKFYQVDVASPDVLDVFSEERPDIVIHLAAQVSVQESMENPVDDARTNILGTIQLIDGCRKFGVRKIVYASSCAVYGTPDSDPISESHAIRPLSAYGTSKWAPESYLKIYYQLNHLSYAVLRYANVYGPRQRTIGEGAVVPNFICSALHGDSPVIYGDGLQTRDFIYVDDVAEANLLAAFSRQSGTFNIGSGESVSISKLYSIIAELLGSAPAPLFKPARQGDIRHSRLDNRRAQRQLGWHPSWDLKGGLTQTIQHYRLTEQSNFDD